MNGVRNASHGANGRALTRRSGHPDGHGKGTALPDVLCVWCRRHPIAHDWRPFCSNRCKIQDLARWAEGAYAVPEESVAEVSGSDGPDPDA